ncbi:MAG: hypothetical protein AB1467_07155 [Candidatus Diapherotrites archaeon]
MDFAEYLQSGGFLRFVDETLRQNAWELVDHCFQVHPKPVAKAQLYAIPAMLQANGVVGLEELAKKQIVKETNKVNQEFWYLVRAIIDSTAEVDLEDIFSLRSLVFRELMDQGMLLDPGSRANRKMNRERVDKALGDSVNPYFEHFVCHYLYRRLERE